MQQIRHPREPGADRKLHGRAIHGFTSFRYLLRRHRLRRHYYPFPIAIGTNASACSRRRACPTMRACAKRRSLPETYRDERARNDWAWPVRLWALVRRGGACPKAIETNGCETTGRSLPDYARLRVEAGLPVAKILCRLNISTFKSESSHFAKSRAIFLKIRVFTRCFSLKRFVALSGSRGKC